MERWWWPDSGRHSCKRSSSVASTNTPSHRSIRVYASGCRTPWTHPATPRQTFPARHTEIEVLCCAADGAHGVSIASCDPGDRARDADYDTARGQSVPSSNPGFRQPRASRDCREVRFGTASAARQLDVLADNVPADAVHAGSSVAWVH